MSYAGKESRTYRGSAGRLRAEGGRHLERERPIPSRGLSRASLTVSETELETDWQHVALFAAGAVFGAMVGAGAALLLTPQTGEEVRHELARRGRRWRVRTADAWDDLRDELQYAARRGRRKLGRALRRRRQNRERQNESVLDD
jgi:gas vesicle protein